MCELKVHLPHHCKATVDFSNCLLSLYNLVLYAHCPVASGKIVKQIGIHPGMNDEGIKESTLLRFGNVKGL